MAHNHWHGAVTCLAVVVTAVIHPSALRAQSGPPIQLTVVDKDAIAYATFQSHNQKVVSNPHGIFVTHIRAANDKYTAQEWRLSRSTDGGKTFATLHQATHATNPPVLETDEAGNIYLARGDFVDHHAYLYRFPVNGDSARPEMSKVPNGAAGKVCMTIDRGRKLLYYFAHNNTFHVLGLDGSVQRSYTLLKDGKNAMLQYPHLALAQNGTLYAAWTTQKHGVYLYWDIHCMRTLDQGKSWQKLDGSPLEVPVIADDGGPAHRLSRDDEFKVHSWLSAMRVKDGKLHLVYWAENEPQRQRYLRHDLASGKQDLDIEPIFRDRKMTRVSDSGVLVSRDGLPGAPLYFVSAIDDRTRLACLASDDNGASWYEYAVSERKFPHRVYSIGGARELTSDGSIIGTFTDVAESAKKYTEPHSGVVHFFKIQAGWSSARIASVSFEADTLRLTFTDVRGQPRDIRFLQDDGTWTKWLPFTEKQTVRAGRRPRMYQLRSRLDVVSPPSGLTP